MRVSVCVCGGGVLAERDNEVVRVDKTALHCTARMRKASERERRNKRGDTNSEAMRLIYYC